MKRQGLRVCDMDYSYLTLALCYETGVGQKFGNIKRCEDARMP
jgi:hypothetical protein